MGDGVAQWQRDDDGDERPEQCRSERRCEITPRHARGDPAQETLRHHDRIRDDPGRGVLCDEPPGEQQHRQRDQGWEPSGGHGEGPGPRWIGRPQADPGDESTPPGTFSSHKTPVLSSRIRGAAERRARAGRTDDAASHPDFDCRLWSSTRSTIRYQKWNRQGRGLSPPVRTFTDPGCVAQELYPILDPPSSPSPQNTSSTTREARRMKRRVSSTSWEC